MTLEHFQQFSEAFEESVFGVLNLDAASAAREAIGAPSPQRVNDELAHWATKLDLSAP